MIQHSENEILIVTFSCVIVIHMRIVLRQCGCVSVYVVIHIKAKQTLLVFLCMSYANGFKIQGYLSCLPLNVRLQHVLCHALSCRLC